jgi:hypothetical protein
MLHSPKCHKTDLTLAHVIKQIGNSGLPTGIRIEFGDSSLYICDFPVPRGPSSQVLTLFSMSEPDEQQMPLGTVFNCVAPYA